MNTLDAIRTKRAIRQFSDKSVPEDVIRAILNAGRLSQNSQPWTFVVVRERETLKELSTCGRYAEHAAQSAFVVALVSDVDWAFDIGQTAAYLQLAAWEQGVGSCPIYFHEAVKAKAILGIPAEKHFDMAIAFGYPAHSQPPPDPGGRKKFDETVHWEHW
jgi:nitroreductase